MFIPFVPVKQLTSINLFGSPFAYAWLRLYIGVSLFLISLLNIYKWNCSDSLERCNVFLQAIKCAMNYTTHENPIMFSAYI